MNRANKIFLTVLGTTIVPLTMHADSNDMSENTPYQPGEIIQEHQLPAGYNASASYDSSNRCGVDINANYIYWNWEQPDFKKGELVLTSATASGSQIGQYIDPGYASGFQVGLKVDMPSVDHWNLSSQYTWYQNSGNLEVTTDPDHVLRIRSHITDSLVYGSGTAHYNINMHFNNLDLLLQRPFYLGTRLFANIAVGLDSYWITQELNTSATGFTGSSPSSVTVGASQTVKLNTKAWSLGPKFGLNTNWMLGCGISALANISSSLVYTRYYDMSINSSVTYSSSTVSNVIDSDPNNLNTLRPVTQMFLGLGWNRGFGDDNYRFGLSAGWDFKLLWNYSMIDFTTTNGNSGSDNLSLNGLNIQASFDF